MLDTELREDHSDSPLYSEDLAPIPKEGRTWNTWHLAAIWVGMAVCIPTYLLASYMITQGMSWIEALVIIAIANLIITIPMVLNGHAGVKYGIPFPVIGRAAFGTKGIHIPAVVRAIIACGWFGIQTWIGGLACYAIYCAIVGTSPSPDLSFGKFVGFALFWLLNMYFIWRGTESIKWLEQWSAPILILMGLLLIAWGAIQAGGFGIVLKQSEQLEQPAAVFYKDNAGKTMLDLNPIKDKFGKPKADQYQLTVNGKAGDWTGSAGSAIALPNNIDFDNPAISVQVKNQKHTSSSVSASLKSTDEKTFGSKLWSYILWLTIMVGFWATMSISIADITRYAESQKSQVVGQFIGLPGTMMLYSFVGIFVTCAAVINFDDILVGNDAPWDPVSLLAKFSNPVVVVVAQIFMIIATLSTNIAANVIAPSNAFSNLLPKKISFKMGGLITGIIGIIICPWWLLNEISGILIFISGLLGPVLGIMLADYFAVRGRRLHLDELYKTNGAYQYTGGFNMAGMIALIIGVLVAISGYFIPALAPLYNLSWFSGFIVSFFLYWILMKRQIALQNTL